MWRMRFGVLTCGCLSLAACAPDGAPPGADASVDAGGHMGASDDAGSAGGRDDAGMPTDRDAGQAGRDGGNTPPPDAGDGSIVDAGPSCAVEDPCAGAPSPSPISLNFGGAPSLQVGQTTLVIGEATRTQVEAALGAPGITVGDNAFRSFHCAQRVVAYYVDDLQSGKFQGAASAGDVLARVVTLADANANITNGVTIGGSRDDERAKLASYTSHEFAAGGFDVSPGEGVSLLSDDVGTVTSVTLFTPQSEDRWGLPIDVVTARIGEGNGAFGNSDSFAEGDVALGTAWDQQGVTNLVPFVLDAQARIYSAFGVRIAGTCSAGQCDASSTVSSIAISPPFFGRTAEGIGIGSTRAEVEAAYGAGMASAERPSLFRYNTSGSLDVGIAYVPDESCVERVVGIVLNYRELPSN